MNIHLKDLGKKFEKQWIFRHLDYQITSGNKVAIIGHNGSGKSTLLKLIGGFIAPSEGEIIQENSPKENNQLLFNVAAPYLNLIDEFTLEEHYTFHKKFKKSLLAFEKMCELSGLAGSEQKLIRDFSSGMKQRFRLSLAFFFKSEVILLDEPLSNLDTDGGLFYNQLISEHLLGRTLIIASNQLQEYTFCKEKIDITTFK